jgi:hypothetical protein
MAFMNIILPFGTILIILHRFSTSLGKFYAQEEKMKPSETQTRHVSSEVECLYLLRCRMVIKRYNVVAERKKIENVIILVQRVG